jgi:hypothetical protein
MFDLGNVHGDHLFMTGGRSLAELMEAGEVVAIPDAAEGIIYKRPENCTPLELAAQLTVDEAKWITEEWNKKFD